MDRKNKKIILEDGTEVLGYSFGSDENKLVEIVLNTSMAGYQEIISDPSYTYQAVVMTYPLIGNYGMCDEDYESVRPSISGLIVREYCDNPSNFRSRETLDFVMKKYGIAGVEGVDTRQLARHIRDFGSCKAYIVDAEVDSVRALEELRAWMPRTDAVAAAGTKKMYKAGRVNDGRDNVRHIVALDCGMKKSILKEFGRIGCEVTVVPYNTTAQEIEAIKPDGVFVSNGPGDPEDCKDTINTVKALIGKYPIFGICLGHQIISLAYGARTYKLKFGHRGGNHPVKNLKTGKVEITSQNHSYAVKEDSVEGTGLTVTHVNILDNTIEGVECEKDAVFSVQYHPENAPGPQDSLYLFDEFMKLIDKSKEKLANAEEK